MLISICFMKEVEADAERHNVKLTANRVKFLQSGLTDRDEAAERVIRRVHKAGKGGGRSVAWAVPSHDRRQRPRGRVRAGQRAARHRNRAVQGAGRDRSLHSSRGAAARSGRLDRRLKTAIGYEISFTRYFYKPQPLRSLEAIRADILRLEKETEGLMADIVGATR